MRNKDRRQCKKVMTFLPPKTYSQAGCQTRARAAGAADRAVACSVRVPFTTALVSPAASRFVYLE